MGSSCARRRRLSTHCALRLARPAQPPPVAADGEGVLPPARAAGADVIREGQYVVLTQQSDKSSLLHVKAGGCAQPPRASPCASPG